MEIKKEQYEQIKECFPKQRKPARISNLDVLNAVLYVVENGCKWRSLPKEYGDWHVIYVRINRWAKKGVLERVFLRLQQLGIIQIQVNVISLDSTCIKVHPDGMGALKKNGTQSIGRTRGGWNTKLHMVAASDRDGVIFSLSAGNCGDGPEGRALLRQLGPTNHPVYLLMDRAYEGDETRALAVKLGYTPVVPPKSNRKDPWDYDKELYKQRNQVERLFRRIKRFRRIFTRYDKLDVIFLTFVYFALIVDALM
ncbi:IS5 family transposase [Pseudoflavonifractor sp. 60]|uniref:IS5 family transposase n=1 Tax=Pseudoflavonifractor sp. 60 TaxID=2304576 RepID=UPI0013696138|nr:IS5 family transposase [Pseudoflavonifractor sp. 60]NBI69429.1 IS5 family transposase [Pseudoflavonifractor sp. 60]